MTRRCPGCKNFSVDTPFHSMSFPTVTRKRRAIVES
jgi:hypothetical protein